MNPWKGRNSDRVKAQQKAYYAARRENIKKRVYAWKGRNSDRVNAQQKTYYVRFKVKRLEQRREKRCELHGCVECKDWIDWRIGLPHTTITAIAAYARNTLDTKSDGKLVSDVPSANKSEGSSGEKTPCTLPQEN